MVVEPMAGLAVTWESEKYVGNKLKSKTNRSRNFLSFHFSHGYLYLNVSFLCFSVGRQFETK